VGRRPRRNHTATFKAKVALAAIKGEKTVSELAQECDVHANRITQWKSPLLEVATGVFGGEAKAESATATVSLKTLHAEIGELTLENNCLGGALTKAGLLMGIEAIYRQPNTSKPAPGHKGYPYLLGDLAVTRPNQMWAMDITYVPMAHGFVYLAAVVDWFSRGVLAWRLSIAMETSFCIEAL
jgi:transposase